MTKRCSICRVEKPIEQFHRHKGSPLGRRSVCAICRGGQNNLDAIRANAKRLATFQQRHPARASEHKCAVCPVVFLPRRQGGNLQRFCSKRCQVLDMNRKRRIRHPDRIKVGLRRLAAKRRADWRAYMATQRCAKCGENHPAVLDHHHIDRATKRFPVANWSQHRLAVVMAEAAKCVVLCANCHRKLEWDKRQKQGAA